MANALGLISVPDSNIEMAQDLHFSYTRQFEFGKQQTLAMKLFKQLNAPHFIFWAATAMLLQVRTANEPNFKMLMLGEKLVKPVGKAAAGGKWGGRQGGGRGPAKTRTRVE